MIYKGGFDIMSTEVVKTGAVYRVLAALSPVTWNKISFWGKASDVEFDDGKTAQAKVGAINGITSDRTSKSDSYAASTKMVHGLAGDFIVNIASSDWSSGTTTINGTAYYTCTKTCTMVYSEHPIIYLIPNGTLPTDAEEEAFSKIEMVANVSNKQMKFYSEDNTVALKIGVKGVF
jgi:YHS domain-containing protein